MSKPSRFVISFAFIVSGFLSPESEAAQYRVIEGPELYAFGMNGRAELAGFRVDDRQYSIPAIGKADGVFPLPALMAGGEGRAFAINDSRAVAGYAMTPTPPPFGGLVAHAYFWSETTGPIDLTPATAGSSFAHAISNEGVVVGYRSEGDKSGPFYWRVASDGSVHEQRIGEPDGTWNVANDVNERGLITGTHFYHTWVYDMTTELLEILPMSYRGGAYGLNDRNEVVGYYRDPNFVSRAALWRNISGVWTLEDLGVLPDPHGSCQAMDINNAGTVIGECIGPRGVANMPFIWEVGSIRPIDELLIDADAERWRITAVYDINESGKILAAGRRDDSPAQVVILDPIVRRRPVRR